MSEETQLMLAKLTELHRELTALHVRIAAMQLAEERLEERDKQPEGLPSGAVLH